MKITRRQALYGSLGTLLSVPFVGMGVQQEHPIKTGPPNSNRDTKSYLFRMYEKHLGILRKDIPQQTRLYYKQSDDTWQFPGHYACDVYTSVEWQWKHIHQQRDDVIARGFEVLSASLSYKINNSNVKLPECWISHIDVWEDCDISLVRQRRLGGIAVVSLQIPDVYHPGYKTHGLQR